MFKYAAAIGIDIGRYFLRTAVIRIEGEVLYKDVVDLKETQDKDYLLSQIKTSIQKTRQYVAPKGINPICIGIAVKGFVDHQAGIVLGPDQGVKGWTNVSVSRIINKETGLPVFVGNDANLMTIGEHRYGAAKGFKNVIFVALGTGIGGGIIINGRLYRGVNNAGGEMGQMIINYDGGTSDKGIKGSFEYFASSDALIRRYIEESNGKAGKDTPKLTAKDIFEKSYRKDKVAERVVNENAHLVGISLANLITIFAPEIIVIGGGMAEAHDSYIKTIRKSAFENSLENCRTEVLIERAQLGSQAAILGSAYYGLTRLAGKTI
jgi:glucokinase